ncbi:hypothetical protein KBC75_05145 [Candidatus Shapirobacteria bacterium]|nr:hypothetical protein [Candidatus Shapirobacteria bacterium]
MSSVSQVEVRTQIVVFNGIIFRCFDSLLESGQIKVKETTSCRVDINADTDIGMVLQPGRDRGFVTAVIGAPGRRLTITGFTDTMMQVHPTLPDSYLITNVRPGKNFEIKHGPNKLRFSLTKL